MSRSIPEGVEPPGKDALIRELVGALEVYLMAGHKEARRLASDQAKTVIHLARTTCPEAFE